MVVAAVVRVLLVAMEQAELVVMAAMALPAA
jgi:hypothetical protein